MGIIYQITCKANGKSYIGQSAKAFDRRYKDGQFWVETHNKDLQRDCFEHGKENMDYLILIDSPYITPSELDQLEKLFIISRGTYTPHGYNKRMISGENTSISKKNSDPSNNRKAARSELTEKHFYKLAEYAEENGWPEKKLCDMFKVSVQAVRGVKDIYYTDKADYCEKKEHENLGFENSPVPCNCGKCGKSKYSLATLDFEKIFERILYAMEGLEKANISTILAACRVCTRLSAEDLLAADFSVCGLSCISIEVNNSTVSAETFLPANLVKERCDEVKARVKPEGLVYLRPHVRKAISALVGTYCYDWSEPEWSGLYGDLILFSKGLPTSFERRLKSAFDSDIAPV